MDGLEQSLAKLRADGAGDAVIAAFRNAAEHLRSGDRGVLRESDIEPVDELPDADLLPAAPADVAALLDRTVVIKLNGGLGTSMGMTRAKSLLEVKDGLTFLDISVRQVLALRERAGASRLPLVLMNSFATRADSLAAIAADAGLSADLPADLVQSRVPKLVDDGSLRPVSWPADPELEWAPPGHGDLYPALASSGMLEALLERGYSYAFVSNADNLGAVLDPRILAWFAGERIPFLMEVADRTADDRKGGHLARRAGGGLVLREVAQTDPADLDAFQDIERHRFFNTNTIWLDLEALAARLERDGFIDLPMIVNRKTVDPTDPRSTPVVQLESAMGAAIDAFQGARALRVPRSRFVPVKTTDDLLVLRSDAYRLTGDARIELVPERRGRAPLVRLDPAHYKLVADFERRFPAGAPSLAGCDALSVSGDVRFGAGVVVRGSVTLEAPEGAPRTIADGALLEG